MCAMPLMPRERVWTVDDLDCLPQDGLQYELAEGVLLVTPSPVVRHQRCSKRMLTVLSDACPEHLEVFAAPLDFRPNATTSLQPDLLVVRREEAQGETLIGTPLLVVEILSPSTRAKDLVLKRALYASAGVPSYWVVDPVEKTLLVLKLRAGGYVEAGRAVGDEELLVSEPMPCRIVPSRLGA